MDFRFNAEEQWARDTALALVPQLAARAVHYDTDKVERRRMCRY